MLTSSHVSYTCTQYNTNNVAKPTLNNAHTYRVIPTLKWYSICTPKNTYYTSADDHSRVVLSERDGNGSDYINGAYIDVSDQQHRIQHTYTHTHTNLLTFTHTNMGNYTHAHTASTGCTHNYLSWKMDIKVGQTL